MGIKLLNKHLPKKRNTKEVIQMLFVTKDLSKAIEKRSELSNDYLKNKSDTNRILYKKQRNKLLRIPFKK